MVYFRLPYPLTLALIRILIYAAPVVIGWLAIGQQVGDMILSGFLVKLVKSSVSRVEPEVSQYDFIVVGGGSAGAVIASRLSEDPSVTVLLIEAGGDPNLVALIPIDATVIQHTAIDWNFSTISQENCALASRDQVVRWPRGKMLGGCSGLNYIMYNRGNPRDFDGWAELTGDPKWSFDNFYKYFLKSEDYFGYFDDGRGNGGNHSKGGPQRVEGPGFLQNVQRLLRAGQEVGLPTRDMNAGRGQSSGLSPIDFTMKRGVRYTTFHGYLKWQQKRKNLKIERYSLATKIHFKNEGGKPRAVGVTYFRHGVECIALAKKEIILSGGTIGSAQLLLLSGVGPMHHLLETGIHPVVDLPVGENLQDHVVTFAGPFLISKPVTWMPERDTSLQTLLEYFTLGKGPISVPGIHTNGFFSTNFTSPDWPDISWIFASTGISRLVPDILNPFFNTDNLFEKFLAPHLGQDGFYAFQYLGRGKSRGYLRLRDNDSNSKPIINPRYYSHPDDIGAMIEGMEKLTEIFERSSAIGRELGGRLSPNSLPGCEAFPFRSRAYWECHLRTVTATIFHFSGTCKMGRAEDPTAVVDPDLRVKGVSSLRVADASIMPVVTNANLNAPTIAIGELASELILSSWRGKR